MKLCQFYTTETYRAADLQRRVPVHARLGALVGDKIVDITDRAARCADLRDPQFAGVLTAAVAMAPEFEPLRAELRAAGGDIRKLSADGGSRGDSVLDPDKVYFGPCVLRPSQFMDFYAFEQHVMTMRKKRGFDFIVPEWYEVPAYYNSNATSLIGHGMTAIFPAGEEKMDYECEMACVIGRPIRNATLETARAAIAGYATLNDLSARARQTKVMPINMGPSAGKDFGSALGPYLVTPDEIPDLGALGMRAFVNGEKWTDGRYGTVQHSFEAMIVFTSASRWLYPGDVLGSGTVGGGCGAELGKFLKPGDTVRVEIDTLGAVENRVERDG
jgi:2-keto-4-pentenoate hydratase/2-oxohepta-3-ene-1,7-dioic acid hydratase in catechol pathway